MPYPHTCIWILSLTRWCYGCVVFTIDESARVCSKYSNWYYYFSSIVIELLLQDGQRKFCCFFFFFLFFIFCSRRTTRPYPCSEHLASSKLPCFENLQSQIQVCLYVTSEILWVGGKLTCSDRTKNRKASRGGSINTHWRKSVLHFVA